MASVDPATLAELEAINMLLCDGYAGDAAVSLGKLLDVLQGHAPPGPPPIGIELTLTDTQAEWLVACLGMVMELANHWRGRPGTYDNANAVLARLTQARLAADRDNARNTRS